MSARAALRRALVALVVLAPPAGATPPEPEPRVIEITAKRFEYSPSVIKLARGKPVIFALRSLDRRHGFSIPEFQLRSDIPAGATVRVPWVPPKAGTFTFQCDLFCGSGHEGMNGSIIVE